MILSIIFWIISSFIVYKCFETYDFKIGLLAEIGINIVEKLINGSLGNNFVVILIGSIIGGVIGAGINYLIYLHSNSFVGYLIISIVLGLIVSLILTFIAASIFLSNYSIV